VGAVVAGDENQDQQFDFSRAAMTLKGGE